MHSSVKLESPVEFLKITPYNPLISQCEIKVCYVGNQVNRNGSVITKAVAREIANSLPGSPIVGFWNEEAKDFQGHEFEPTVNEDGEFTFKETTKPIGFVDLNAKVWFAKYLDDNKEEREYLVTQGWLWTGRFPEVQRVLDKGNNQSMELDDKTLNGTWSKDNNGKPQFFIINEAIVKGLCVLGEDVEPCFEGARVTAPTIQFSFDDGFKEQLFSMMNELKNLLNKEEQRVFTKYDVTIGDALWTALYSYVENLKDPHEIVGFYEDGEQKFAVLKAENELSRLDFTLGEDGAPTFGAELIAFETEVEPQFTSEEIAEYAKKKQDEGKDKKEDSEKTDVNTEDISNEEEEENKEKKETYSLDEIPEYTELMTNYETLKGDYNTLQEQFNQMKTSLNELTQFRVEVERKEKQKMIESFYMLSDEDKADVITNIDKYSKDEIEAKLSVICVRQKVSFQKEEKEPMSTTYSFNDVYEDKDEMPAWVKSVLATRQSKN